MIADGMFAESNLKVIPNCIDTAGFDREAGDRNGQLRAEAGAGDGDFLWLAAGRLEVPKDYPSLIRAFAQLRRDHPRAVLAIAGEGRQRGELESLISKLDLSDRCRLLGLRRDLPALYKAADGLVLSSRWEGLPNVVMEAACASLPVVTTDVGGARELVTHGENGLVVRPENSEMLSEAMGVVMTMSSEERKRMGQTGRKLVEDAFAPSAIVDRWDALLVEYAGRV